MGNEPGLEKRLSELIRIKPNESAVDFVINTFKELIIKKGLEPGDKIPPEMELAKLMSVSRGSIREAMKILSSFGLVDIRRGDGTYVSKNGDNVTFDPVLFSFILSKPTIIEIHELRMLIENDVMELAIKNISNEDLERLRCCVDRMKRAAEERKSYSELAAMDIEFHQLLGDITKNRLVKKIYSFILDFFTPSVQESHRNQGYNAERAVSAHENIIKALELKDSGLAVQAVKYSIDTWEDLTLKSEE